MLTLPLPTSLAFYSYYLADGWLKLTTIYVHLSEILITWFFFSPVRSMRIFAFYWLLFLQVTIIATGNYGYLNFIVIAMLFSLLDDSHFKSRSSNDEGDGTADNSGINYRKVFSIVATIFTTFFIFMITMKYYRITFDNGQFDASICESLKKYF